MSSIVRDCRCLLNCRVYVCREEVNPHLRPYLHENTASRPISKVKHGRDSLVLSWETRWESGLLQFPSCSAWDFFPPSGDMSVLSIKPVATRPACTGSPWPGMQFGTLIPSVASVPRQRSSRPPGRSRGRRAAPCLLKAALAGPCMAWQLVSLPG